MFSKKKVVHPGSLIYVTVLALIAFQILVPHSNCDLKTIDIVAIISVTMIKLCIYLPNREDTQFYNTQYDTILEYCMTNSNRIFNDTIMYVFKKIY